MYRKNTASQFVCFQLLLTADGTIATGLTPTVRRCIDGTFAAGGGSITEDTGTGAYKYAMSQADTNGNDISFVFTATGAIPVCVNIVTTVVDPTAANFGMANVSSNAVQLAGQTITAAAGVTFPASVASPTNITAATGITVATNNDKTGYTVSTNNDKSGYALTTGERQSIADELLNRDMSVGTDSGNDSSFRTPRQALRFLRNKWSIAGTTLTVTKEDDATTSWSSQLTTTAGANPVTASDPAGAL